ncbi:MAG: hypothetical protein IT380_13030 [Myxococcales bacterium]|nr:hypothetical protein [Myxococcales bacterium]
MEQVPVIRELFRLVVLSLVLERALAFIFEVRLPLFIAKQRPDWQEPPKEGAAAKGKMLGEVLLSWGKALFTLGVAYLMVRYVDLRVLRALLVPGASGQLPEEMAAWLEHLCSALVVAGGSAGAIKLFQDVLGFGKTARDAARDAAETEAQLRVAKAHADLKTAEATQATAAAEKARAERDLAQLEAERARAEYESQASRLHTLMLTADLLTAEARAAQKGRPQ